MVVALITKLLLLLLELCGGICLLVLLLLLLFCFLPLATTREISLVTHSASVFIGFAS